MPSIELGERGGFRLRRLDELGVGPVVHVSHTR
jgi:hypothetical protein